MDAQLIKQVADELAEVEWLSKAGAPADERSAAFELVPNERDALRYLKSREWEHFTEESQAWLTTTLSRDFREHDRDWDKVVAKAKSFLNKKVKTRLDEFARDKKSWGKVLEDSVNWDVVAIFAERYYVLACLPGPMALSRELEVYRAGRLPCAFEFEGDIQKAFEAKSGRFSCY